MIINFLVVGGCNKKIYDEAIQRLGEIEFKIEYFARKREDFKWNKNIYIFNTLEEKFTLLSDGDILNATCGSSMIKIDKKFI